MKLTKNRKLTNAVGNKLLEQLSQSSVPQLNDGTSIPRIAPSFNSVLGSTINNLFGGFRRKKTNRKRLSKRVKRTRIKRNN